MTYKTLEISCFREKKHCWALCTFPLKKYCKEKFGDPINETYIKRKNK